MIKLVIFASGSGTNAEEIIKYFNKVPDIKINLIMSNNPKAYVIERAKNYKIDYKIFNRKDFYDSDEVLNILNEYQIDFIILAGFLWLLPKNLVEHYSNRIINIHPALLPLYGGKGMYGAKVHEAVLKSGDKETGITIHFVNELYDEGAIIFQAKCPVHKGDTVEKIQERVHKLEHKYFPSIIEKTIRKTFGI